MCWVNAGFFCVHLILRFRAKKQRKKEMEDNFKIIDSEQGDVVIDFNGYILREHPNNVISINTQAIA